MLKKEINTHSVIKLIFYAFALFTLFHIFGFFFNLSLKLTDYAWGDISWVHQAMYNFSHGRILQSSTNYNAGIAVKNNPFAYISQIALHINFSPYLLSPLYKLIPNLYGLYAIVIAFNFIGCSYYLKKIIKFKYPNQQHSIFILSLGLLSSGTFLSIVQYKCLFLLYSGPFFLGLLYYYLISNRIMIVIYSIIICLISDDAAVTMISFSFATFFLFNKTKLLSFFMCLLSFMYTAFSSFCIMPAAKYNLETELKYASDLIFRIQNLFLQNNITYSLKHFIPIFIFFPAAYTIIKYTIGINPLRNTKYQFFFLVIIAPIPQSAYMFVNGGPQHLLPIYILILFYFMINIKPEMDLKENVSTNKLKILSISVIFTCLLNSALLHQPYRSYFVFGHKINIPAMHKQSISNINVLEAVDKNVPKEASLVYWTNRSIDGYITNKSDVWRFPFQYDKAEYLILQKDMTESFYTLEHIKISQLPNNILNGKYHSSGEITPVKNDTVKAVADFLVQNKSYDIILNNDFCVLLKRQSPYPFIQPEDSIGLNFLKNIPKILSKE